VSKVSPVSLGYPLSVFNKNSTLKHAHMCVRACDMQVTACILACAPNLHCEMEISGEIWRGRCSDKRQKKLPWLSDWSKHELPDIEPAIVAKYYLQER